MDRARVLYWSVALLALTVLVVAPDLGHRGLERTHDPRLPLQGLPEDVQVDPLRESHLPGVFQEPQRFLVGLVAGDGFLYFGRQILENFAHAICGCSRPGRSAPDGRRQR